MNSLNKKICFLVALFGLTAVLTGCSFGLANKASNPGVNKFETNKLGNDLSATTSVNLNQATSSEWGNVSDKNWINYRNDYWGIKFSYPPFLNFQETRQEASYDNSSLFLIQSGDKNISVKIVDDSRTLPYTESEINDYLNASYHKGDNLNIEKIDFSKGESYKISKKDGKSFFNQCHQIYTTLFERGRLVYVVEMCLSDEVADDNHLDVYKKIVNSFELIVARGLPDLSISLKDYDAGGGIFELSQYMYKDCRLGLKCVDVKIKQDGDTLVAVDFSNRSDFEKFGVIADYEKDLLNSNIVEAINLGDIRGYSRNSVIYLVKGDYVYIINWAWFPGDKNKEIIKTFTIK